MNQALGNKPSFDNPKAGRRTNVPSWVVEFERAMKSDGTYIGQTDTKNHKDGSAEAQLGACLLAKEAFQISQAISNSLECEPDEDSGSKSRREAAIWASSFVPPGMIAHHGKQKKKFVSQFDQYGLLAESNANDPPQNCGISGSAPVRADLQEDTGSNGHPEVYSFGKQLPPTTKVPIKY